MNPIEMMWAYLDHLIAGQEFETEDDLFDAIGVAFMKITPDYIKSLFSRWNKNLQTIVERNGGPSGK